MLRLFSVYLKLILHIRHEIPWKAARNGMPKILMNLLHMDWQPLGLSIHLPHCGKWAQSS